MKIGIVILNWNGVDLLKTYLPSVVEHSKDHVIYLADNASIDASIKWTQSTYPEVKIIAMDENRGYAGGYNVALKSVKEEVVCLLNSDVAVTAGWCDVIANRFHTDSSLAACQPKILDHKRKDYFEYAGAAGGFLDRYAYPYCRGRVFDTVEKDLGQYNDSINLHWASGACLFLRLSSYKEVDGLDEDYFAHQEEIDLCWRLRHAGYTVSYEPESVVYHLGGGTLATLNPRKTFYNFRNSLYNIFKNERSSFWVWILIVRMVLDGVTAFKFLIEFKLAHFMAVLKAHFHFYLMLRSLFKKRKTVGQMVNNNNAQNSQLSVVYQYFIKGDKQYSNNFK
ncbi:glycosyltransferase family 2 protein [uncultured Nonlabens sp.]|uniref:glycosyltransferase family 2 protein n=1 Tax=uncultured Nonlabens sp. TaxID=859306 RepID=UPI0026346A95|nr:glycosyltransferase family 2 protein [uncultured Nonlabens sp.]